MAIPLIVDNATNRASGVVDRFGSSTLVWSDEFGGTVIKADRWAQPTLERDRNGQNFQRRLWQVNVFGHDNEGNVYLDSDGNPDYGFAPEGKRHAIWYNGPRDSAGRIDRSQVQYVANDQLVLAGRATNERDPTIDVSTINPVTNEPYHPYFDDRGPDAGVVDLRSKIYGSWLQGAQAIEDVNNFNEKIVDPQSPRQMFRYGFYQFRISFAEMQRGTAYRVSAWLMPMCDPADPNRYLNGAVYDTNPTTGCEVDLFEHENAHGGRNSDLLLMKSIDGADKDYWQRTFGSLDTFAPGTEATVATQVGPGYNLRAGYHVIGLWWSPTGMRYYLNGHEANVDLQRIPKVAQAFFWTREGNTCLNNGSGPVPYPPYRQRESGYLYSDNIGKNPSLINNDRVLIDYLRIWQDPSLDGAASNPDTNWISAQAVGKIDPETPGGDDPGEADAPTVGTGGGAGGGGTGVARDDELSYAVHYEPVTRTGVPATISIRVLSKPANAEVDVAWTHDAGAAAEIEDPSALSTTITMLDDVSRLIDIEPNPTLRSTIPNEPPVARAGRDVIVDVNEFVTLPLDGEESTDPEGGPLTYAWTDAGGNVVATTQTLTTFRSTEGSSVFTLTVTDEQGASHSDSVTLTARAAPPPLGVPEILSLTADGSTTLILDHTEVDDATGYATQVLGEDSNWIDLGYHLGRGRPIQGGSPGQTRQVRMRAEDRSVSPARVSDWSATASGTTEEASDDSPVITATLSAAAPSDGYVDVTISWTDTFSGSRQYAVGVDTSQPTNDPPDAQRDGVYGNSGFPQTYTFRTRADGRTLVGMVVGQSINPVEWRGETRAGRFDITDPLTLPTQDLPAGSSSDIHNGIGIMTAPAYNSQPWNNSTIRIGPGQKLQDFEIEIPEGSSRRHVISCDNPNSSTEIGPGVIKLPDSWYRDAYGANEFGESSEPVAVFMKNGERPHVHDLNIKNGHRGVVADSVRAPRIERIMGMHVYRHTVQVIQCRTASGVGMLVDGVYAYTRSTDSGRSGGSPDHVNIFRPIVHDPNNPNDVRHIVRNIGSEGGFSNNGSTLVMDSSDWGSLNNGGVTASRIASLDAANKVTAIGGGMFHTIEDVYGYQGRNSHVHQYMSAKRTSALYCADYIFQGESSAIFRGHRFRRIYITWYDKDGDIAGFWKGPSSDIPGYKAHYGGDSSRYIDEITDVRVNSSATTRAETRVKLLEYTAAIPVYDGFLPGDDENFWANRTA